VVGKCAFCWVVWGLPWFEVGNQQLYSAGYL
jgi:hypothetical protein